MTRTRMAGRISFNMTCLQYFFRYCERSEAIPGSSFRDGALAPDPESRDSGFDASHRPGMTACGLLRSSQMTVLDQMQGGDDHIDRLDADERNDDAPDAVDHQVAAQQRAGADGAIGHALQSQRNQRDDDQRVEDDRRQDRALRARQMHDVE